MYKILSLMALILLPGCLISYTPHHPPLMNTEAQIYLLLAENYENQRDPLLIASYYQKALHLSPHSGQIQNNYGVFLCHQGQYRRARQYLHSAAQNSNYAHRTMAKKNLQLCDQGMRTTQGLR